MSRPYRLSAEGDPAVGLTVHIVRSWLRGEIAQATSGHSNGTFSFRDEVLKLFERFPGVSRVLMVRGQYSEIGLNKRMSPPFLVCIGANGQVFDMAGEAVTFEPLEKP